jgi:hypothetical protein
MNKFAKAGTICWGLLSGFALFACSNESTTSVSDGTTEERNALWNETANLKDWNVMKGSEIKLENTDGALLGRVSLKKSGSKGAARAGIAYGFVEEIACDKLVIAPGEIKEIEVQRLQALVHQHLIADARCVLYKIENMDLAV